MTCCNPECVAGYAKGPAEMTSVAPSLSPTQPSSASVASAATATTATTTSSPTQAASTASPVPASTASSVSSPQPHLPGPGPGPGVGGAINQLPPLHHAPGPPHHHGAVAGPSRGPPSTVRSAPPGLGRPPPAGPPHLQASLPSASAERQVAEAREAVVASIGNMLDGELQSRAALLHANNAAVERQFRDVDRALAALRREDDRLQKVADDAARRIKELGNVQNWAEILEKDFQQLEETMRLVREGSSSLSGSGSDASWSGSESGDEGGAAVEGNGEGGSALDQAPEAGASGQEAREDGDGDVAMAEGTAPEIVPVEVSGKGKAPEAVPSSSMDVDAPAEDPSGAGESADITAGPSASAPAPAAN